MNSTAIPDALIQCLADWEYFEAFNRTIRLAIGASSDVEALGETYEVLDYLLKRGFIQIGDLAKEPPPFRPWAGTTEQIVAMVKQNSDAALKLRGGKFAMGDVCWINLTPLGRELGELFLADRKAGPEKWINKPNQ